MSRKLLFFVLIATLVLAACAGPAQPLPQSPTPEDTPAVPVETMDPDEPVSSDDPTPETPEEPAWLPPQPEDEDLIRQEVTLTYAEVLTLESFPPQFRLNLRGEKGNPCAMLRVAVAEPDPQNRIMVDTYVVVDPAAICIQVLETFDISVPIENVPAGEYTVYVNNNLVGEIVMPETG